MVPPETDLALPVLAAIPLSAIPLPVIPLSAAGPVLEAN